MNDKVGRLGSMKAQKRILEKRAKEIEKMTVIQKEEEKLKRISNEEIKTKFQVSPFHWLIIIKYSYVWMKF